MRGLLPADAPSRPFLDFPVVTDPSGWNADLAVLGIRHSEPYAHDAFPNDQAHAPDTIREASKVFCYNPAHWDFDTGAATNEALPARRMDIGNVGWSGTGDYGVYSAAISERVRHFWRQGAQLIVLGGDHGVTIPVLDALDAVGEPVHIFHVDAHLDWRDDVGGVKRGYSNPLRRASENPAVSGMTQIGMRGIGSARRQELEAARAYGSKLFTAEQIHRDGMEPVLATIPKGMPVYVTIDADGLDPTEMPAVMAPTPGGLYYRQLAPLLRAIAKRNRVVGIDVVEVAPSYDFRNALTSVMAGRLILNAIGGTQD
jgi:agmatinase